MSDTLNAISVANTNPVIMDAPAAAAQTLPNLSGVVIDPSTLSPDQAMALRNSLIAQDNARPPTLNGIANPQNVDVPVLVNAPAKTTSPVIYIVVGLAALGLFFYWRKK